MMDQIFNWVDKISAKRNELVYGRAIIVGWVGDFIKNTPSNQEVKILDVGVGHGTDLAEIMQRCTRVKAYGIDLRDSYIQDSRQKGITVYVVDIEHEAIPVEDEYFDIVIVNQVVEHVKNIFWLFSEVSRVIKKKGVVIVGVPNVASLQSRLLLLFGEQPRVIELLGPHIRGITNPSFRRFIEADGYFVIQEIKGRNFCHFPTSINTFFANLFPTLAGSLFYKIERTNKKGVFIEVLKRRDFETVYYTGDGNKMHTRYESK